MSESAPERSEGKPKGAGLNKKVGPLPLWGWGLAAGGVAGLAFWWLRRGAAGAAAAANSVSPQTQAQDITNNCYDYQGNLVPCTGYNSSGTSGGTGGGSGGGTGDGGGGTGTGDGQMVTVPNVKGITASAAKLALEAVGLVAGSEGANGGSGIVGSQTPGAGALVAVGSVVDLGVGPPAGGGTNPPPPPPHPKAPAMPSGIAVSGVNHGGFQAHWKAVTGATSYVYRITYQGKLVLTRTFTAPNLTVSGLEPNRTYTLHLKACNAAGCSAETNGPAVKTAAK